MKNSNISNEILEIWAKEGTKLEELISQEYYDNATRAKLFSAANAIANVIRVIFVAIKTKAQYLLVR